MGSQVLAQADRQTSSPELSYTSSASKISGLSTPAERSLLLLPGPKRTVIRNHVPKGQGTRGQKVHVCGHIENGKRCTKTYSRAEHLRRHWLSHAGPLYVCGSPGCGQSFVRPDLVRRHVKLAHPEGDIDVRLAEERSSSPADLQIVLDRRKGSDVSLSILPPLSQLLGERDPSELRFLHHHIQNFDRILLPPEISEQMKGPRQIWLQHAQEYSMQDNSVHDMVLSFACGHLAYLRRNDDTLWRLAAGYFAKATSKFRQALDKVQSGVIPATVQEIDVLMFMSVLNVLRLRANVHELVNGPSPSYREIYAMKLSSIAFAQGFQTTFDVLHPTGLLEKTQFFHTLTQCPESAKVFWMWMNPVPLRSAPYHFDYLLDGLDEDNTSAEEIKAYRQMWNLIEEAYAWVLFDEIAPKSAYRPPSLCTPGGMSGVLVSQTFLKMCYLFDPRAMGILAHYILVDFEGERRVSNVDELWWTAPETKAAEVMAIALMIKPEGSWMLEWPLQVIRDEVKITDVDAIARVCAQHREGGDAQKWDRIMEIT